jgi:hypothetical protein
MFALTTGEAALVLFLFALAWGAGLLPRFFERIAARLAGGDHGPGDGPPARASTDRNAQGG